MDYETLIASAGIMLLGILFVFIFLCYIYSSITLMFIGKKLSYDKPWLAWIPGASFAMVLQLGGFHWALVFLILGAYIPFIGLVFGIAISVLSIISYWKICEKRNFPGWTTLLILVPILGFIWMLILLGILAWKD